MITEKNDEINDLLRRCMSPETMKLQDPGPTLVRNARKMVAARKKSSGEVEDFFSLMAAFLNFRIKLYHAVIIAAVTGAIILFATREDHSKRDESRTGDYVSNIASVRSSTVLSSIYTFGLNKTQYDGRTSN